MFGWRSSAKLDELIPRLPTHVKQPDKTNAHTTFAAAGKNDGGRRQIMASSGVGANVGRQVRVVTMNGLVPRVECGGPRCTLLATGEEHSAEQQRYCD